MQEQNIAENSNSSEILNVQKDIISPLSKIFYSSPQDQNTLLPIIKCIDELPHLFYILRKPLSSSEENKKINFKEKFEIFQKLMTLFKQNTNLINLFTERYKTNFTNFYEPIIELYLDGENASDEIKSSLEEMLIFLINKVSIPKFIMEKIYQKLSIYLRYNTYKEKIPKMSQNVFMRYLNLLEIFYTNSLENNIMEFYNKNNNTEEELKESEIITNYIEGEKTKEIKNYLYFNGSNSKITLFVNENSNNLNCDFPTLQFGCSFAFWINLEENVIKDYYSVNNDKNSNKIMTLVRLMFGQNQIRVQLINENNLLIIIDDIESEPIDISKNFKYGMWNNICINIYPKKNDILKIIINGENLIYKLELSKNNEIQFNEIQFSEKISNISLFENLIGKINSVLFCSFTLNNDIINYFKESQGFYKIKHLYNLFLLIDNNYYQYSNNYKYIEKFKNKIVNRNFLKININNKEQNIKNIMGLFCCFTHDKNKNQIDDVFGNFKAVISSINDGANNYIQYSKNIEQIGEINNLLPIIELMLLSQNKDKLCSSINMNKNDINIEDLLTEEIFLKYMHIVKKIIKDQKLNLICANKTKFFSHLGLFIEKFPPKLFSNRIRNLFYEIGKETFQFTDEKSNFSHTFINMILLNEKIFSKFSEENQLNLWGDINKFFTSDYSQLKDSLNMSKICLILRFYDKDRYTKYCCKRHADLFEEQDENNILNPDMNAKVGKLFETIQLFVDNLSTEPETANLFKLLSLDLSPCLQKKIIRVYQKFFDNRKIQDEIKEKALDILLKNQFFDIFEYCLSISLLDVRIQFFELLRILHNEFKIKIDKFIEENKIIIKYIGENILPDNLKIENKNNHNEIIPLNKYFNKDIYNDDIISLYDVLNNWIKYKIIVSKKEGNIEKLETFSEANSTAINIFVKFVSKVSPYYLDCLLILLFSIVTNTTINNRETFLNDDYFYKWLYEIIFFFNNKENENLVEESQKTHIENIKAHSIELFKFFIKFKNPNKAQIISYLLDYSFYLKEKNKNKLNQIKDITNTTRMLLSIMAESLSSESTHVIDVLARVYFEFIFLYKNSSLENTYDDKNKINNIIIENNNKNTGVSTNNSSSENNKSKSDTGEDSNDSNKESEDNTKSEDKKLNPKVDELNPINSINDTNPEPFIQKDEHNKSFDDKNRNIITANSIFNLILIPDSLMNSIYLKINDETKTKDSNILNSMWEDFNLYNFIFDYYHDNLWGIEAMCNHVKISYDKNGAEIFGDLVKKYSDNKHKNVLAKMLIRYLNCDELNNINDIITDKKTEKINIFNCILILLCIAFDITQDKDERILIENQIEQFLIFCVLCSLNITTSEKSHSIIQNRLYDLLGYGLLFFKKRDEEKYSAFFEKIIRPLFEGTKIDIQKKGIKGIFALPKKFLCKHTAIERLFVPQDMDIDDNDDELLKTLKAGSAMQINIGNNLKMNLNENKGDSSDGGKKKLFKGKNKKDKENKKESKKDKNKNNKLKLVFCGDADIIVKHVVDDTIKDLKKERKKKIVKAFENIKEYYYQNQFNKINNETDLLIIEEKRRINSQILSIVPDLENNIRKYSSTSLVQEKKRRNHYQKVKKQLFSWRSFWSQKDLFYDNPNLLKLKVKNHYTKEMTKILLTPILDIDYYMPCFKKFNPEKLFNKDDIKYKINLNIENILLGKEDILEENKITENMNEIITNEINDNINDDLIVNKNKYGFNYLECLYKLNYEGLWEKYRIYYEQKINYDINDNEQIDRDSLKSSYEIKKLELESNKIKKPPKKKESKKNRNKNRKLGFQIFKCCLVKPTHHLTGYITCNERKIKFKYSLKEKNKKLSEEDLILDPSYDRDMNNCFGSTFKECFKDKDKVNLSIYYKKIKYIFIKRYFYQITAMEIYTTDNTSYFFNFKSNSDLTNYLNQIFNIIPYREIKTEDHKGKKILGYEHLFIEGEKKNKANKSYYISNKIEEWQNYKISTLEYLMWLNIYSGRSFNDLTQYPVFPWLVSNYSREPFEENDFRNLSLPIGMMEFNDKSIMRKETFIETYDTVKNDLKENNHDFNYQDYLKKGEDYFYYYRNKKLKMNRNYSVQIGIDNIDPNLINTTQNNNTPESVEIVEINQLPSYYGSHYSNPTYVCHFLTRVFPFSFISIEIQGEKFDDPNRLFHSMEKTFESCMTLKDDVRELIPEFYYFPEIFKNSNNLNLTQDLLDANGEKIIINDVELPSWANKKGYNFIIKMRDFLENNKTKINKWIDIIFGILQKGEKAEEIHNIFQAQTYEGMVRIDKISDLDMRDAMMRLVEVGVTPMQIFDKESKGKIEKKLFKNNIYSYAKGIFLDDKKCKLNKFYITSKNYKDIYSTLYENDKLTYNKDYNEIIYPSIIAIKCRNPKNLKIFTNKNSFYNIKISNHDNKPIFEEKNINYYQNNSSKFSPSFCMSEKNIPFIIYNNEKYIIKGGFWDCHLEINSLSDNEKKEKEKEEQISTTVFVPLYGAVVTMKMTSDEKLLFCGTNLGNIIIFKVKGPNLKIKKILYSHSDTITSISINETLNMFASSSKDGFINIYILPSYKMIRSILLSKKSDYTLDFDSIEKTKKGEFIYANEIFISSTPLPCYTIYISENNLFKTYSINGDFIYEEKEDETTGNIKSPIVFQNLNFADYLIYGTEDGFVKIRSFPEMKLINSIKPFEGQEIITLELSPDKRFCYAWSHREKIAVIKDINTSTGFEVKEENAEHEETLMEKIGGE